MKERWAFLAVAGLLVAMLFLALWGFTSQFSEPAELITLSAADVEMQDSDRGVTLVLSNGSRRRIQWVQAGQIVQHADGAHSNVVVYGGTVTQRFGAVTSGGGLLPSGVSTNLQFTAPETGVRWRGFVVFINDAPADLRGANSWLPTSLRLSKRGGLHLSTAGSEWIGAKNNTAEPNTGGNR